MVEKIVTAVRAVGKTIIRNLVTDPMSINEPERFVLTFKNSTIELESITISLKGGSENGTSGLILWDFEVLSDVPEGVVVSSIRSRLKKWVARHRDKGVLVGVIVSVDKRRQQNLALAIHSI